MRFAFVQRNCIVFIISSFHFLFPNLNGKKMFYFFVDFITTISLNGVDCEQTEKNFFKTNIIRKLTKKLKTSTKHKTTEKQKKTIHSNLLSGLVQYTICNKHTTNQCCRKKFLFENKLKKRKEMVFPTKISLFLCIQFRVGSFSISFDFFLQTLNRFIFFQPNYF